MSGAQSSDFAMCTFSTCPCTSEEARYVIGYFITRYTTIEVVGYLSTERKDEIDLEAS